MFRTLADPHEYLAAFMACDGPPYPVLGVPRALAVVEDLHEDGPPALPSDEPRYLVIRRNTQVERMLRAFAAAAACTVIVLERDIDELPRLDGYTCVAGEPADFSERDLLMLQDLASAGRLRHVGALIGAGPEALSWLLAKQLAAPRRRAPLNPVLHVFAGQDFSTYGDDGVHLEAARETLAVPLLQEHTGLLTFVAHGREDCINLMDTVVCGRDFGRNADHQEPDSRAPVCALTAECFRSDLKPADFLPADRIMADVILANTCMGLRTSAGLFSQSYLLPFAALAGVPFAYLSAPNQVLGLEKVNLIISYALGFGATLGEAVTLVNGHLRAELSDLPHFLPIGAPWLRLPHAVAPPTAHQLAVVDVTGITSPAKTLRSTLLIDDQAAREWNGQAIVMTADPNLELAERVLGTRPVQPQPRDEFEVMLRSATEAIEYLGDVSLLGVRYPRQNAVITALRECLASTALALRGVLVTGETVSARKRGIGLTEAVNQAERELAMMLWESGATSTFKFEENWGDEMDRDVLTEVVGTCDYCGRNLWLTEGKHTLSANIRRHAALCARCRIVWDLDPRSPVSALALEAPEFWHRDTRVPVRLRITSRPFTESELIAQVGFHSDNGKLNRLSFDIPAEVRLVSGGHVDVEAIGTVESDARMHQEYVRAMVVVRGTISYACMPILVRPPEEPR